MLSATCEQLLYSGDILSFVQGIQWDLYIRLVVIWIAFVALFMCICFSPCFMSPKWRLVRGSFIFEPRTHCLSFVSVFVCSMSFISFAYLNLRWLCFSMPLVWLLFLAVFWITSWVFLKFNILLVVALCQVLLGDVGAGKSSLVLRFVKGQFVEFQVSVYWTLGGYNTVSWNCPVWFWCLTFDVGMLL